MNGYGYCGSDQDPPKRVNECSAHYQMIGKVSRKWLKQEGGIGLQVIKEIGLK